MIDLAFVLALMVLAIVVCIGQLRRRTMWRWIAWYWFVLALKLLFNALEGIS